MNLGAPASRRRAGPFAVQCPNACAEAKGGLTGMVGVLAWFCRSHLTPRQWKRAESARGLAQSKTLPRGPQVSGPNAYGLVGLAGRSFHQPKRILVVW